MNDRPRRRREEPGAGTPRRERRGDEAHAAETPAGAEDGDAPDTSHLFVAVWPGPAVTAALQRLERPSVPAVRWTRPEQWHVTLRFLGRVEPAALPALEDALAVTASAVGAAHARAGPAVERLGREILAVPVEGLERLAAAVVEATAAYGRPPERRPFRGHLTLARGRVGRCGLVGRPFAAAWDVEAVELLSSRLGRSGPCYRPLGRWLLDPPAAGRP
ncbi:MAG TPA: RNA 2',3'-cyclic phosphodiesterase [Acidimicrobiales bacterium]|nr:RNA 2',3'-cyclic phosphodiesterase [Acidimicrobiales bacterium]